MELSKYIRDVEKKPSTVLLFCIIGNGKIVDDRGEIYKFVSANLANTDVGCDIVLDAEYKWCRLEYLAQVLWKISDYCHTPCFEPSKHKVDLSKYKDFMGDVINTVVDGYKLLKPSPLYLLNFKHKRKILKNILNLYLEEQLKSNFKNLLNSIIVNKGKGLEEVLDEILNNNPFINEVGIDKDFLYYLQSMLPSPIKEENIEIIGLIEPKVEFVEDTLINLVQCFSHHLLD